jgi:hypothetical protein
VISQSIDFRLSPELASDVRSLRTKALALGVAGAGLTVVGAFLNIAQFYQSYLWATVFWLGVAVGCLAWLMVQYLTGGAWGVVIRRVCESSAKTIPLFLLLFIPIILGIPYLYGNSWGNPALVAQDEVLRHKQPYLNTPFFIIRGFIYLGGWSFCGWFLNKWSDREDRSNGIRPRQMMAKLSAPGLIFWAFGLTFLATDWVLSIEPHWFSTMFGLLFMAGQGLSSMSFIVVIMVMMSYRRPMSEILTPRHLHDLGKLLLANVMVWAYFSFSQFLITWAGNLPEEIPFYLQRLRGGWGYVALILVFGHFALPFALLLSRDLKRNFKFLSMIAIFIFCMRFVDVYWLVAPDFHPGHFSIHWMDFTAPIGIGGIWLALFFSNLLKRPIIPPNNPNLEEALAHGRE